MCFPLLNFPNKHQHKSQTYPSNTCRIAQYYCCTMFSFYQECTFCLTPPIINYKVIKSVTLHYLNLETKAYNLSGFAVVFTCNADPELLMSSTQLSLKTSLQPCNDISERITPTEVWKVDLTSTSSSSRGSHLPHVPDQQRAWEHIQTILRSVVRRSKAINSSQKYKYALCTFWLLCAYLQQCAGTP